MNPTQKPIIKHLKRLLLLTKVLCAGVFFYQGYQIQCFDPALMVPIELPAQAWFYLIGATILGSKP